MKFKIREYGWVNLYKRDKNQEIVVLKLKIHNGKLVKIKISDTDKFVEDYLTKVLENLYRKNERGVIW